MVVNRQVECGEASWSSLPVSAQQELDEVVAIWRTAAEQGYPWAQVNLSIMFETAIA
jgi:hypothetical protein